MLTQSLSQSRHPGYQLRRSGRRHELPVLSQSLERQRLTTRLLRLQSASLCTPDLRHIAPAKAQASLARLDTYALASAQPQLTGLPMVVYISEYWSAKTGRHTAKLYVSQSYSAEVWSDAVFSVTIERDVCVLGDRGEIRGRDVGLVMEFIELNMPLLLAYWKQDPYVATIDMLQALRKVEV